jgi:hypothetical protein
MISKQLGFGLPLCGILIAATLAAATIKVDVASLGVIDGGPGNPGTSVQLQRFTYHLSDIALQRDQELNIRFDPALFGPLSNPTAGPGYHVLLFQPNQPLGAFGDFSALSLVDQPGATSDFTVDFVYLGAGVVGPQPYFINQFEADGGFATLETGFTSQALPSQVPEPATFALCGVALLLCGAWRSGRR